ncbi:MAG: hypothetical protein JJU37_09015 [Balneolaceae bacterium]|nr:hypothetical protein [Balneolaceae bacterium]
MNLKLTVEEKYSQHWPLICVISIVVAAGLFYSYQITANVLLEGYLRLASFGFLALSILSYFKIRDGKVLIDLETDADGALNVKYSVRNNYIHSEDWSLSEIHEVKLDEMPNRSLYNDLMKKDRCVRFKRKNENDWIYFNKIDGRVIPFTQENAEKIKSYLEKVKNRL